MWLACHLPPSPCYGVCIAPRLPQGACGNTLSVDHATVRDSHDLRSVASSVHASPCFFIHVGPCCTTSHCIRTVLVRAGRSKVPQDISTRQETTRAYGIDSTCNHLKGTQWGGEQSVPFVFIDVAHCDDTNNRSRREL